jgi:hypothetical protein
MAASPTLNRTDEGLPDLATSTLQRSSLCDPHRSERIAYDWLQLGYGIALAGGAYPMVFGVAAILFGFCATVVSLLSLDMVGPTIGTAILGLFTIAIISIGGGLVGMAWTTLVALITLPCIYLFARSFNLDERMAWIGPISGGLVGVLAVLPVVLNIPTDTLWEAALLMAIGPGLTTVLGQIGGAWGGSHSYGSWTEWKQTLSETGGWVQRPPAAELSSRTEQFTPPRFQFSIRHLFWLGLWLSALLSLIRMSGEPFETTLPLVFGWTAYQTVTLVFGAWVVHRIGPWWTARRERRST